MRHGAIWLTQRLRAAGCRYSQLSSRGVQRWSSTYMRTWSTPLAKTIADAIEVCNAQTGILLFKCTTLAHLQLDLYRRQARYQSRHTCVSASRHQKADTTRHLGVDLELSNPISSVQRVTLLHHPKSHRSSVRWSAFGSSVSG
jgi:hypothetical protein